MVKAEEMGKVEGVEEVDSSAAPVGLQGAKVVKTAAMEVSSVRVVRVDPRVVMEGMATKAGVMEVMDCSDGTSDRKADPI